MKNWKIPLAGLAVASLVSLSAAGAPQTRADGIADQFNLSPFLNFKQIETAHFRITFPVELADTAERAANDLEEANATLSPVLYWKTESKTQILLIDNTDSANGETSPLGRFGIVLYVTPPNDWYSTSAYDDWLRLLCFHEYTHLLNMDATRGFWQAGRYLFGPVLLPNSVWPSWMLEGLAVYMETRFTHSGRGRSPFYEMILRAAVEAGVLDTDRFYTLDRVNGTGVPYYPGGESVYLFGYELMNEVAMSNRAGPTADGQGYLRSGGDVLGVMSERSSGRFPWFINGNLENITGRSWYDYWAKFVRETKKRAGHELAVIRSQPLSPVHRLTHGGYLTLGSAFSPDGRWLAYVQVTLDQELYLYVRDLRTGKTGRVAELVGGSSQLSFTPDSKYVLFSSMIKQSQYTNYNELGAYSVEGKSIHWLTHQRRAADPDVSRDGKRVVFTLRGDARTSLAVGRLEAKDGKIQLKDVRELVPTAKYDVISNPRFSADGKTVYYALHRNGQFSEELMAVDIASGKPRTLVDNGHFNRFPAVGPRGQLYFVSDLTGVDNLYRYREGQRPGLFSNVTTGISFPSVASDGSVYGALFSYKGWELARFEPLARPVAAHAVAITGPQAPRSDGGAAAQPADKHYKLSDYSVFPSLWPRGWIPYAYVAPSNVSFGEAVVGFDAVDRHRYLLSVGYDTLSASMDWLAEYQNRQLGPTITAVAQNEFSYAYYSGSSVLYYARDSEYSLGATFTSLATFSSLTPYLALTFDRTSYFTPGTGTPFFQTQYLPDLDTLLGYSNTTTSKLAIGPESGRDFIVGSRYYLNNGNGTGAIKGVLSDTEYYRLGDSHAVLSPSFTAAYTSATPATNPNQNSDVIAQGYYPLLYANPVMAGVNGLPNASLSRMPIRGYPFASFFEKAAMTAALDFRFPVSSVFRGWGTNPFFLSQIYGTAFGEASYFPDHGPAILPVLPAAGGGLTANFAMLVQVPLSLSVQYQYGFQKQAFGTGNVVADLGYSGTFF